MKRLTIPSLVALVALVAPGLRAAATTPWVSVPAGDRPRGIAVGDVERNGNPDLIVANFGSPSFIGQPMPAGSQGTLQLFSPSASGLQLKATLAVGAGPRDCAFVPVGARWGIVLVTLYGEDKLKVYRWESDRLTLAQTVATGHQPVGVTVARLGSGPSPSAVVCDFGSSTVSVYPINAFGQLGDRVAVPSGPGPVQAAVGDLDGDGVPEIAVACLPSQQVQVFKRQGAAEPATYALAQTLALPPASDPSDLRIVDLNGDGRNDLVVANFAGKNLTVYPQNAAHAFDPPLTAAASGASVNGMAVGVLKPGENPTVVLANRDSDTADLFRWTAKGLTLLKTVVLADGTDHAMGPVEAALIDTNLDGTLELAVTHMRTGTVRVVNLKDIP